MEIAGSRFRSRLVAGFVGTALIVSACTGTPAVTPAPTAAPVVTPAPTAAPVVTPAPTAAPVVTPAPTAPPVVTPAPTPPPATEPPVVTPAPEATPVAYTGPAVELNFTNFYTGPDLATMTSMIAAFNAAHPNITVKNNAIDGGTEITELPNLVVAGKAPDVEAHHDFGYPHLAPTGTFEELTPDMLAAMAVKQDSYFANVWDLAIISGKIYGVPWGATSVAMYYNKTLLTNLGISGPPTNREELLADSQKCTTDKAGKKPGEDGFDGANLDTYGIGIPATYGWLIGAGALKSNGGDLWDASYNPSFNSPAGVEELQFLSDLTTKYHVAPSKILFDGDLANFRAGKSCFLFNGLWEFIGNTSTAGLDFGVAPLPRLGTVQDAAWGGAAWLVLPKQKADYDPNKRAASMAFIAWMTSHDGSLAWTASGNLPARPDVAADPAYASSPFFPIASHLETLYIPSGFPWIDQINGGWGLAYDAVLEEGQDPATALANFSDEAKQNVDLARPNYPNFP